MSDTVPANPAEEMRRTSDHRADTDSGRGIEPVT